MKRILITGSSGGGKTTLAKIIAKDLKLRLVHLDKYFCNHEKVSRTFSLFSLAIFNRNR